MIRSSLIGLILPKVTTVKYHTLVPSKESQKQMQGHKPCMCLVDSIYEKIICFFFYLRQKCRDDKCGYFFIVESVAHLDNPDVIRKLIELNR